MLSASASSKNNEETSERKTHNKTIKKFSSLDIQGLLEAQTYPPSKHVVRKARKKPKGKPRRNEKEWVVKPEGLNPAYLQYMKEFYQVDAKDHPKDNRLYIDALLSIYINAMSSEPRYKSHVVSDETQTTFKAKMSVFIPGLKTFNDLLGKIDLLKETEQLLNAEDADQTQLLKNMKELEYGLVDIFNFLNHTPDKNRTLASFADACVTIHRLDIKDLHLNNIGIDQYGDIALFDVEHGLQTLQDRMEVRGKYRCAETAVDQLNYSNLGQQPNVSYFGIIFQNFLNENIANLILLDLAYYAPMTIEVFLYQHYTQQVMRGLKLHYIGKPISSCVDDIVEKATKIHEAFASIPSTGLSITLENLFLLKGGVGFFKPRLGDGRFQRYDDAMLHAPSTKQAAEELKSFIPESYRK